MSNYGKNTLPLLGGAILAILILSASLVAYSKKDKVEGFDAAGLVFNKPPEWFNKGAYDLNNWIVYYEPDQISKPECMHYRGNAAELNWLSSSYRFWRQ
jgi:hypothetical protein